MKNLITDKKVMGTTVCILQSLFLNMKQDSDGKYMQVLTAYSCIRNLYNMHTLYIHYILDRSKLSKKAMGKVSAQGHDGGIVTSTGVNSLRIFWILVTNK